MRLLIRAIILLGVLLVTLTGIGFFLSDKAHVERSANIDAPPATVFALVNSFRQFDKWSPWADKDPAMKVVRSGPEYGVGAHYAWAGNGEVGAGSQEIVASVPNREVTLELHFSGFDGISESIFTIAPQDQGSRITWALDSRLGDNPINRYFGLFMDKMVGPDYVRGLARLKALAEQLPKTDFSALKVELDEPAQTTFAYVSGHTTTAADDIAKALAAAYGKVEAAMKSAGLQASGPPLAVTRRFDPKAGIYDFDAGIPISDKAAASPAGAVLKYGHTPSGTVLIATHTGPYDTLTLTHDRLAAFEAAYAFVETGDRWEQYVSDPGKTPADDLITTVNVPVK